VILFNGDVLSKKASILVVDDEKEMLEVIGRTLSSRGYEADLAADAKLALEKLTERKFDLLVTDVNMPGLDGIELIRYVLKINPYQKIIIITGFPSQDLQAEAFKLGVLRFMIKPFTVSRFTELVADTLASEQETGELVGPVELGCEDLIQLYALGQKSLVLEIRKTRETGRLYFVNGEVVHAETERNQGEAAFFEIQDWKSGTFVSSPIAAQVKPPRTITTDVTTLLIEGARKRDETGKRD
jgi:CheY-like chemotaxis protein